VDDLIVLRTKKDKRSAWLKWGPVDNAYAYNLYMGVEPDKLYNCVMVHSANEYWLKTMDNEKEYYFAIEAINENGVGVRSVPGGFIQEYPYAEDIERFKENDKLNPPPQHAILFAGSSSFTMWTDVKDYFPGFTIINRGFGGSTLLDQIHYAEDVILPYLPKQIVIYCGENDVAYSDTVTGEMVAGRFVTLFIKIRSKLPDVKITYITMKPSPSRWHLSGKMTEGNDLIRKFLATQDNTGFINIWDDMLNEDGMPDPSLFLEDMLHMNEKGYRIWQKKIEPELVR
jgi:lysophospholipase L1-like esterase